jgi:DNA-directed RNA polymerase I, II, and III subunit RPABC1
MEDKSSYSANLIRLWRVYRTTKEMLYDRGYQILEEDCNISLAEFSDKFSRQDGEPDRGRMVFSAQPSELMLEKYAVRAKPGHPDPPPEIGNIMVEFNSEENVGVKHLRDYMAHLATQNFYSGIMVCAKAITSSGMRGLRNAREQTALPGGVELFLEQDLLVNITKHELVPKHILLSREEKMQLLNRYRLKESQLPRIQVTDPVAKYLGLRRGQVVKIIRKSETAGRYASYRWAL